MEIRPIRTEADYKAALKEAARLIEHDPDLGTSEGDHLDVLATLIQAYEARHYPIDLPDPIEAIKFRMEQAGLTAKDLEPMIGQRNRVYEILNRKRSLTLPMIWKLHQQLGISAESLIRPTARA
ncbi:helix-turn-helix domain-containing protein [Alcaligenaceae bacterium CGII-47]|nr:helix-turn-helix domain-containing protein [Alcaligenaceae bacterium CGII-47]